MEMNKYVGTQVVEAGRMTRGEYAEISGRKSILKKKGETAEDAGYLVRYEDGHETWMPADVFERMYQMLYELSFGHAIELMKKGYSLSRAAWHESAPNRRVQQVTCVSYINPEGETITPDPHAAGSTAIALVDDNGVQMGWVASQADMLAKDWYVFMQF